MLLQGRAALVTSPNSRTNGQNVDSPSMGVEPEPRQVPTTQGT
jgi:hypothetical protein